MLLMRASALTSTRTIAAVRIAIAAAAGFAAFASGFHMLLMGSAALAAAAVAIVVARVAVAAMRVLAAFTADLGHVLAISTDGLTSLAAWLGRFLTVELMRVSALMRGLAALACDFALLVVVHRRESSITGSLVLIVSH